MGKKKSKVTKIEREAARKGWWKYKTKSAWGGRKTFYGVDKWTIVDGKSAVLWDRAETIWLSQIETIRRALNDYDRLVIDDDRLDFIICGWRYQEQIRKDLREDFLYELTEVDF